MNISTTDLRIGSRVVVATNFGVGTDQTGIVLGVFDDIKNGQAGIDYHSESDPWHPGRKHDHWAYLHQVREIIEF